MPSGRVAAADTQPQAIAVDGYHVSTQNPMPVSDASGSLTVDYATTGSGTATGALRVELPTNGTGIIGGITNTVTTSDSNNGYSCRLNVTRPSDTIGYTAGDVVGASTGASGAVLTFTNMGPTAGRVLIRSFDLELDRGAAISGETTYTLHLYDATPASALGDNGAWDLAAGDRTNYLGAVSAAVTPADLGSTMYISTSGINKQVKLAAASTSLFGYLVTTGAYTPTSGATHSVTLHAERAY